MAQPSGESPALGTVEPVSEAQPQRQYGFSALLSGFARMWSGTAPALLAIVGNALVQSLLTYWNPSIGMNLPFIIAVALSFVVLVFSVGLLSRTALNSVSGRVGVGEALSQTRTALPTIVLWATVMVILVMIGALINPVVPWLIIAVLAFVPLAAADGKRNALGVNFKALGERWGRWLVTAIFVLIVAAVLFLLTTVNVLFVKGFPASLIAWLGLGIVAWWLLTSWAEIYRSTRVGAAANGGNPTSTNSASD